MWVSSRIIIGKSSENISSLRKEENKSFFARSLKIVVVMMRKNALK